MRQKKQAESEEIKTLKRRLAIPIPEELKKQSGGTCGIELTADDEKILDAVWEKERQYREKTAKMTTKRKPNNKR